MRIIQILFVSLLSIGVKAQQIARITFPSGYGFASVPNVGSIQFISDKPPTGYLTGPDGSSVVVGFLLPVFNSVSTASVITPPDHHILVYPNPFGQIIQLETRGSGSYSFQLMDTQGRRQNQGKTSAGLHLIDTRALASGMYVLRITGTDGNFELHKIIKIN